MDDFGCFIPLIVLISMLIGGILMLVVVGEYPTAMDVYRGKTTLEHTIVDGEKVDSCVIFKE